MPGIWILCLFRILFDKIFKTLSSLSNSTINIVHSSQEKSDLINIFAQILPYVNGTLYSLLTNPKIAASARSLHISEKLKLAITATANDPDLGGRVYTIVKF